MYNLKLFFFVGGTIEINQGRPGGGGGSGTPVYPIKIRQNTQNNYTQVTYMVTPMYALYVTQQGLLVVSLTEEQGMKITLSFWISGVVPKTSSFCVRVNTTSTRGIKQLGIYFGSVSIFPMKVVGGH